MSSTKQTTHLSFTKSGTAATAFHLSDTLDWSSTATCKQESCIYSSSIIKGFNRTLNWRKEIHPKKDVTNFEI